MMKYYIDENERHAASLSWPIPAPWEVAEAIKRLCRRYKTPRPSLIWRGQGGGAYQTGPHLIRLSRGATWLLVAHETAHAIERTREREARRLAIVNDAPLPPYRRAHGKRHARLTDRIMRQIEREGWHLSGLAHAAALREDARRSRAVIREAARPPMIDEKICHREEQIRRLERKAKALQTRIKTARRSLAALMRARKRKAQQVDV